MRWTIRLGKIAGTELRIHLTFFLLLAFFGAGGYSTGGLPAAVAAVLMTCLVFLCVVLHEFGHAFAARHYGIRTPDITLYPIGGVARIERMPEKPWEEVVIALAGPMVNVVIATGLWLALFGLTLPTPERLSHAGSGIAEVLLVVNVMLLLFNLLPAFPMDGGRVLRAFMAMSMGHDRATQIAARVGQMLAVGLGFAGMFGISALGIHGNPMLILVAIFVFTAAANEAAASQMKSISRGLPVSEAMVTEFKALPRNASLAEAADVLLHTSQHEFPVVDPDGTLRGLFTRSELVLALRASGPAAPVSDVMQTDFPAIHPRTLLEEAFQMMQARESSALPVTDDDGILVGLFTLENVGEMLMVKSAIAESQRQP